MTAQAAITGDEACPAAEPSRIAPDLLETLRNWEAAGRRIALATVTLVEGSAPVAAGPVFAVNDADEVAGSIGGGCLEGALIREARMVLETGRTAIRTYGGNDGLLDVPSLCGGVITLELTLVTKALLGTLGHQSTARASLYLVGANAYAAALSPIARELGYEIRIIDPRPAFLTSRRFTGATTIAGWPSEVVPIDELRSCDAVVLLSHDQRFEDAFLARLLCSDVGYVGALGSRIANAGRLDRLREAGVDEHRIARLAAPVGLAIGAHSAFEIAISIAAEMIAVRYGRSGGRLVHLTGRLH